MGHAQRYVSDELTHFIGRSLLNDAEKQFEVLIKILSEGWMTHPPHNPRISGNLTVRSEGLMSENQMYNPEVVCFCDIPRLDLGVHVAKYGRFGLSFRKPYLVAKGASPVFYVASDSVISMPADLSDGLRIERARVDASKSDEDPDNYYREREWRIVGNVQFSLNDVHCVLIPSAFSIRFRDAIPEYYGQLIFTD